MKKVKSKICAQINKEINRQERKEKLLNREFYLLRSILGYQWAIFYFLLGGRQAGKSYATTEFFIKQWRKYKRPFYWLRLTENSTKKLLANNAEKLIDPDLRRKYNLDLFVNGSNVYEVLERDKKGKIVKKVKMAQVFPLNTFYNDKGSGLFDKDFLNDPKMFYNICLDEMNREKNEKRSFDIVYAFVNQLENLVRNTKQRVRIICIGNTLEEASDILSCFNFLPETFGRFPIKKKRAVIEYMEPTEKYKRMREGSIADILAPDASTFTNEIKVDSSLVSKKRLIKPLYIVQFGKTKDKKFTIWDSNIIARYNNENCPVISMRPYMDTVFNSQNRDNIIIAFDNRGFYFRDLITFKLFQKELELLKPRK